MKWHMKYRKLIQIALATGFILVNVVFIAAFSHIQTPVSEIEPKGCPLLCRLTGQND